MRSDVVSKLLFSGLLSSCFLAASASAASGTAIASEVRQKEIAALVDGAIAPLIKEYAIPGMAVAVTVNGESYFYNYGVTSLENPRPVTSQTLFEIGSNSKPFAATIAAYAQATGKLSLNDQVSQHVPTLKNSHFDHVSLLNLATYTASGLPLQVPEKIQTEAQLMEYLTHWKSPYTTDDQRVYSNISIGLLGMAAARSMNVSYDDVLQKQLFPMLGMTNSYLHIPPEQAEKYAQGYSKQGVPVRLNPGLMSSEAYAIKSGSADMMRFVAANMGTLKIDSQLQQALNATHTGYYKVGAMTQALAWERYPYPASLTQMLAGNADGIAYQAVKADKLSEPVSAKETALYNKTGSTNGFASYVAYVPNKKIGIVMLANKNYPIASRVTAAYKILNGLDAKN